jgi:hypothetical protein
MLQMKLKGKSLKKSELGRPKQIENCRLGEQIDALRDGSSGLLEGSWLWKRRRRAVGDQADRALTIAVEASDSRRRSLLWSLCLCRRVERQLPLIAFVLIDSFTVEFPEVHAAPVRRRRKYARPHVIRHQ